MCSSCTRVTRVFLYFFLLSPPSPPPTLPYFLPKSTPIPVPHMLRQKANFERFLRCICKVTFISVFICTILNSFQISYVFYKENAKSSLRVFVSLLLYVRVSSPPGVYKMALSVRLGRTASKEQYAFLYR